MGRIRTLGRGISAFPACRAGLWPGNLMAVRSRLRLPNERPDHCRLRPSCDAVVPYRREQTVCCVGRPLSRPKPLSENPAVRRAAGWIEPAGSSAIHPVNRPDAKPYGPIRKRTSLRQSDDARRDVVSELRVICPAVRRVSLRGLRRAGSWLRSCPRRRSGSSTGCPVRRSPCRPGCRTRRAR